MSKSKKLIVFYFVNTKNCIRAINVIVYVFKRTARRQ